MKKFLFLTLVFSAVIAINTNAQSAPDPATMLQQMKQRTIPQMVEKTGLTEAQANRVVEINFEIRQLAAGLRDLNEADRSARLAELKTMKQKKYSDIPLTAEQIKSVQNFYEEMARNAPPKPGN